MGRLYIIPNREDIQNSLCLAEKYGAAFEYNDFWKPEILDDYQKQEEIIDFYRNYRNDFSQDTMHGAFLDVTIHSEDSLIKDASIKRIYQSMDIAKRMGLRAVIFHTGLLSNFRVSSYLRNWKEKNKEFFTKLASEYPNQQIILENMFDDFPFELAELAEEMRDVPNFGVCFDYAHGIVAKASEEQWVRTLAPFIVHMHINDNDLCDDLHQAIGEGKIDWRKFDELMQLYHIDASVLIEVNGYDKQKRSLEYLKEHAIFPFCGKGCERI